VTTLRSTPCAVARIRLVAFESATYQHLTAALDSM
jgi:hypothetical protein